MAIRVPRGFEVSRPYYNELCEGQRPVAGAAAREAWTGLAHVRVDEHNHDPIVLEPGFLVGQITGEGVMGQGKMVPAFMGTGLGDARDLVNYGASNVWGLPTASGDAALGKVKPLGICYQPIYSFHLQNAYTNYTRNSAMGILTDYVIQIPAVNSDEWDIYAGDVVCLGNGNRHGIAFMPPTPSEASHAAGTHLAGRYAAVKNYTAYDDLQDRIVGRCLKRVKLGTTSSAAGTVLADDLANFTADTTFVREYADLDKIQTTPGLNLTGSGTKGIPAFYLGAKADTNNTYWGLTLLIRL